MLTITMHRLAVVSIIFTLVFTVCAAVLGTGALIYVPIHQLLPVRSHHPVFILLGTGGVYIGILGGVCFLWALAILVFEIGVPAIYQNTAAIQQIKKTNKILQQYQ